MTRVTTKQEGWVITLGHLRLNKQTNKQTSLYLIGKILCSTNTTQCAISSWAAQEVELPHSWSKPLTEGSPFATDELHAQWISLFFCAEENHWWENHDVSFRSKVSTCSSVEFPEQLPPRHLAIKRKKKRFNAVCLHACFKWDTLEVSHVRQLSGDVQGPG